MTGGGNSPDPREFPLYDPARNSGVTTEGPRAVEILRAREREEADTLLATVQDAATAAVERWRAARYPGGQVMAYSTEGPVAVKVAEPRGWLKAPAEVTYYEKPPLSEHVVLWLEHKFYLTDDGKVCYIEYAHHSFLREKNPAYCSYMRAVPISSHGYGGWFKQLIKALEKVCP